MLQMVMVPVKDQVLSLVLYPDQESTETPSKTKTSSSSILEEDFFRWYGHELPSSNIRRIVAKTPMYSFTNGSALIILGESI